MATIIVNAFHASSMSGMREESETRRLFFGKDTTDISVLIGQKFCARVGVDGEENYSLWFGQVLGVQLGHGLRLLTTVGEFVRVGGCWKLVLQNGNGGAETEFDFVQEAKE